jgi:hypothetical protein
MEQSILVESVPSFRNCHLLEKLMLHELGIYGRGVGFPRTSPQVLNCLAACVKRHLAGHNHASHQSAQSGQGNPGH